MLHRQIVTRFSSIGALEFEAIGATSELQSDGYALDMAGADLSRMNSGNANLLWSHDEIIGKIERAWIRGDEMLFRSKFASPGVSTIADQKRKLLKDGVINSCSVSFSIQERVKITGGYRAIRWTALEISLCAVPVDAGAVVTERSMRAGKILSSTNAEKLREAHEAAEICRAHLADVLDGAGEGGERARLDHEKRQRDKDVLNLRRAPASPEFEKRQRQKDMVQLSSGAAAAREHDYERRQREARNLARN